MKELSIKVSIAGRIYPLTVKQDEEEGIRKAVKEIDMMVKDYEKKYAVKDKQDLLAMCALQYSTEKINLESRNTLNDNKVADKIKKLEEQVNAAL